MSDLRTAALRALNALSCLEYSFGGITEGPSDDTTEAAITDLKAALAIIQPEIKDDKPFGYFRAEPFGWTDCAPTDEGAIPLYERPQQPPTPPETQTEAEKVAYCAGWWDALEKKRAERDELLEVVRDAITTLDRSGYPTAAAELRDAVAKHS